ncbi:putative repeat protein (TIGR01451 family)/fimbrial isopeptide formation D2 family protein [Curtobacterium flaccumfaciens]|uniref:Putative repeat protein (TIGR01451 family)/fimbrial isopeptide formation D2 family protein n=1 Tax=Curtobacterium flaccumfaciens TaxID=2035 RepID=A0A4R6DKR7_9MICO|nr:isopeptide-forming domain-containing fimbrial protein [Curtobacterium flaccumfaciens]TDN45293.1 putative repeat protein (TIGR01451 family)/fimbrial isopeptide formation D2 family protein [Curtobacterium flaccumfaciens]
MRPALFPARPRALAMTVVVSLLAALLSVFAVATPTQAADSLVSVSVKADGSVLNGAPAGVTITAKNTTSAGSGTPLYNLGYTYRLPVGVAYTAGSAGPQAGEPTITTLSAAQGGGTLLVWSNVSDLVAGDQKSIAFTVQSVDASWPVGTNFTGTAQVAASTDARTLPTYGATGTPMAAAGINAAAGQSNATTVSALSITKGEQSPENELVRGVHDHPTVYTLTIKNTAQAPTNGVVVTDYLPAGLEFLQCGAIDNTTSGAEYPGAASLTATTASKATGTWDATACRTPQSVETVNTVANQGSSVFTKVVWNLGDLAKGATVTVKYLAAVPLRANTMSFAGQPGQPSTSSTAPAATSLQQAADLDNNNGASTRQDTADTTSNGHGQTNLVDAQGTYTGSVGGGATSAQKANASLTVEAMDLAVAKSVSPTSFAAGKLATYSLLVRTSEYESSAGIALTDTLPDGLCPAFPAGTPTTGTLPADCDPSKNASLDQQMTGATIDSVAYSAADGTFTVRFHIADQATNAAPTVTYKALMRQSYSVTGSAGPTAAGDDFTNKVAIAGTSTGVHGDTGTQKVVDDSRATITSNSPQIQKSVLPRSTTSPVTGAADCAAATGPYSSTTPTDPFTLNDVVCFRLQVTFPAGVQSRNATVTDMLPVGTSASAAQWVQGTDWAYGSESTVPSAQVQLTGSSASMASFSIGSSATGGTYVDGDTTGATVVLYVAARITKAGSSTTVPDITANLMKFAQQNTAGSVTSLRSAANYKVAGPASATLAKSIVQTGKDAASLSANVNPANTTEGQVLQYRLRVTNPVGTGGSYPISNVSVWDALPVGIDCTAVDASGSGGTCTNTPPAGASSTFSKRSFVVWSGVGPIASGATADLLYTMQVPAQSFAGTAYKNSASVVRFDTTADTGVAQTWVPAPVAGTSTHASGATGSQLAAVAANDQRTVTITPVVVAKTGGTDGGATNRSGLNAVPGQPLAYTYSVTVKAGTSVGSASLIDPLAAVTRLKTTSATTWTLGMPGAPGAATRGMTDGDTTVTYGGQDYTFTGGATTNTNGGGALVFPAVFDNTTGSDVTFTVTVTGLAVSAGTGAYPKSDGTAFAPSTITNTATFRSTDPVTGASVAPTKQVAVGVTAPNLAITKTDDRNGAVVSGQDVVTWTLTATNKSSTTDARSVFVADCFPSSLQFTGSSRTEATGSLTQAQRDAIGACGTDRTLHAWDVGTLAPGASTTITVTGTLADKAPAGTSYANTAKVVGSSLDTDYTTAGATYVQTASADDTITVASPSVSKQLTAPTWSDTDGTPGAAATTDPRNTTALPLRPGDAATYRVTATIPANVSVFDTRLTDVLPAGLSVDGALTATTSDATVTATGTVDAATRSIRVDVSDIATGRPDAVTVTVSIPVRLTTSATAGTALSNTANLAWDKSAKGTAPTDGTATSNPANATVVAPSLSIDKTATVLGTTSDALAVEPGQTVGYTVTVTNAKGASPAYGTTVTDCVPAGIVVDGASISDGGTLGAATADCGGGVVTWPTTTVGGAGASVQHTYSAKLADDVSLSGAPLTNTVSTGAYRSLATGGASYPAVEATATVTPAFPDVAVAKANDTVGGLSYIGVASDFSVTFTNQGSAATKVSATDVLPANWQYVAGSATIVRDGGAATAVSDPATSGRTLSWSDLGPLAANATMTLHYRATPTSDAATTPGAGSTVAHTNHVTATVTDASGGTSYDGGTGSFVTYPNGGDDAVAAARIAAADLALTKTATTAQVVAGATTAKAWTITVTNTGGDAAHGTTVVDAPTGLPAGASLAFTGTGWSCTPADGTWTCVNGATVAKGASFPELDVALTLPSDAPLTAIRNTATIEQGTGQTFDPNTANDRDTASVTPVAIADLTITKTGPSAKAPAGGTIAWNLSVRNVQDAASKSVSDARGTVTVTDTLPDTVTLVSATSTDSGWTCDTDDNTVTCTRDGLVNGQAAGAITITATVHADVTATETITNTAAVAVDTTTTTDPTSSNDSSTATTRVDDGTSLTIAKRFGPEANGDQPTADQPTADQPTAEPTADQPTLVAGNAADWTIRVQNTGTADARNVTVTDTLLDGTRLQPDAPLEQGADTITQTDGAWTCTAPAADGSEVTCVLDGTLAAGKATTFTITVTTPSSMRGALTNTAVVTADNAASQQGQARSDATQTAGLSVTKRADVESIDAGQDVTYTITVANPDGPSDLPAGDDVSPSVLVQDTLPAGVEFRGLSAETAQHWTLVSNDDGVLTLAGNDGIAVGATDPNTIVVTVHVPASFRGSAIVNTVTASPVTAAGPTAHDAATVDVTTHADLSVTKERTSAPSADAGTDVTYDVTVANAGPSDARDVTWTDTPPTGMTVTAVTTDDDAWEQGSSPATWSTATLASGASTVFHVTASVASGTPAGTLTNTATVSSATPDTDPSNDTADADVAVTTHAALGLSKTPVTKVGSTTASGRVTAGAEQVWLVQVSNAGPSDEQPTTVVTDQLPEGLTFVSASSDGSVWTCDGTTDPKVVTCSLPTTIVAGKDAPGLWITTKVASGYTADRIENRAVVTSQGTDPLPGTNDRPTTSPLDVDEVANVAITLGHEGSAVIGKDLPETVQVRNAGLSDAAGVTATYTLPKGLTYVSTEADPAWTVTGVVRNADGSTTVSFALAGTLTAGSLAPAITVHQTPTAAAYPGVQPSATVATSTTETTLADNDAADELAVDPASSLSITKTHTGQLVRGKTVGYTITVRNGGPTEDPGPVVVTDRLPEGLALVSVNDGRAATCTSGQTVTCTLTGPLAVGGSVAFQVTARVASDAPDRITNVATVASPTTQVTPVSSSASPTDPQRAADPAPVRSAPKAAELAFTGAAGLGIGALLALLAMAAGGVLLLTRRRRRA